MGHTTTFQHLQVFMPMCTKYVFGNRETDKWYNLPYCIYTHACLNKNCAIIHSFTSL